MVVFEVIPKVGIGPIKLGMDRSEVYNAVGKLIKVANNREEYLSGFFIDFDDDGKVCFIELAKSNSFQALFKGKSIHDMPANEVIDFMSNFDTYYTIDPKPGYSYLYKNLQMTLWRGVVPEHDSDEDGKYFEAIGLAAEDYFSKK